MSLKLQIIIIILILLVLIFLVNMIKNKKIELKYALSWLLLIAAVLVLTVFPKLIGMIADLIGVDTPINMLFFAGFCFSLIIIFSLTVALSRASQRIRKLAQDVALLEKKLDKKISNEKE